jgi:hypothetical protein
MLEDVDVARSSEAGYVACEPRLREWAVAGSNCRPLRYEPSRNQRCAVTPTERASWSREDPDRSLSPERARAQRAVGQPVACSVAHSSALTMGKSFSQYSARWRIRIPTCS